MPFEVTRHCQGICIKPGRNLRLLSSSLGMSEGAGTAILTFSSEFHSETQSLSLTKAEREDALTWAELRGWPARMREKAQRMPETYCGSGSGSSRSRAVARAAIPSRNASETGFSSRTSAQNSIITAGILKALHSLSASLIRRSATGWYAIPVDTPFLLHDENVKKGLISCKDPHYLPERVLDKT